MKKFLLALLTLPTMAMATNSPIIWGPGCAYNLITHACLAGAGGVGTISALTGDVTASGTGAVAATVVQLQGRPLASTAPTNGQVIMWNSTSSQWEPGTGGGGGGGMNQDMSNMTPTAMNESLVFNNATPGLITTSATLEGGDTWSMMVKSGDSGSNSSGAVTVKSGAAASGFVTGGVSIATSDAISANSGSVSENTGSTSISGDSGSFIHQTGSAQGNSGGFSYTTGDASAGNSGDFSVNIGAAGGTRGHLRIVDGSESGGAGYVWTLLDTAGNGTWMPASGAPTGNINTVAFFDGSGNLASDAALVWNDTRKSMLYGSLSGAGTISTSTAVGALAFGQAQTNGSILINASAPASLAFGQVNGAGSQIQMTGSTGALCHGKVLTGSGISCSGEGSYAGGSVTTNSGISTGGRGGIASGYATSSASIGASGNGSLALGHANGTNSQIISSGDSAWSGGVSVAGFSILADNVAGLAYGQANFQNLNADGITSIAFGDSNVTTAEIGLSAGLWNNNNTYLTTVLGRYSVTPAPGNESTWVATDPLLVVGNGASDGARNNALTLDKSGNLTVASVNWHHYTVNFNDAGIFVAGLTGSESLFTLPAQAVIEDVVIRQSASFTGGAIATYTLSVGTTANHAKYATAFDVLQAPGSTVFKTSAAFNMEDLVSGTPINVYATSTVDNLDQAVAGDADVWVKWEVLP